MKSRSKTSIIALVEVIIGLCLTGVLSWKLISMGVCPNKYIFFAWGAFAVLCVLTWLLLRVKALKIPVVILWVFLDAGLIMGMIMVGKIDSTMKKISNVEGKETVQLAVYVKNDSSCTELSDLSAQTIAYAEGDVYTEPAMSQIDSQVSVYYLACEDVVAAANALIGDQAEAVLIKSSSVNIVSEIEGLETFSSDVRAVYYIELEEIESVGSGEDAETAEESAESIEAVTIGTEEVEETVDETAWLDDYEAAGDDDTFIMYISGIDTWGSVNIRQNGDVNILVVVNMKTGKIQLINTPRDYYVYLPNSGSVKDKLTHAGCYGVDTSVGTLEMLYGINIDYYLKMNFSGFEKIIDTLGGVDVYSEYDFTVSPIKHYVVGVNHLTGLEALAFARERHAFAVGDIQRGKNQMAVVTAMIQKMESSQLLYHFPEILNEVSDCIVTSMPTEKIYGLIKYQIQTGMEWSIDSYTVTGSNGNSTTYTMPNYATYVMIPNDSEVAYAKQLIESCLNGE